MGNPVRNSMEDGSVNGRIILKCMLRAWGGTVWTIWYKIGHSPEIL
jgi:hypothetical protein